MLMQMRKPIAKVITFALFGLLILSFALWGVTDVFTGPGRSTAVAEVGDVQIDQRTFSRDLGRELRRLEANFGQRLDIDNARALGVVDDVLRQLVNRALFDQKAAELGMVVSDEQIRAHILREPAFQNQFGEFDQLRFSQALQASSLTEPQYVAGLSRDIQREQLAGALTGASRVPEPIAAALFAYGREERLGEVIVVEADSITELPEADEAALAAHHEENSAGYMTPETRSLSLVYIEPQDLAAEIAVDEAELQAEFEARREDFAVPERRSLNQVVFTDETKARGAKTALDGGASLSEAAESAGAAAPIELGTLTEDELAVQLPALAEPVFAVAEGAMTDIIQSDFGWHIVEVIAVEPGKEPSFQEVREEIAREQAMNRAIDSLISIANQLDDELGGGASLEEAAAALDLTVNKVPAIDGSGRNAAGQAIEGLPPLELLLEVIRETEVGEDSLLNETPEGGYFVLRVDGVTPAAVKPLDQVRAQVLADWQQAQRAKLAEERATALAERAREGIELAKIAEEEGLPLLVRGPVNRFGEGSDMAVSRDLVQRLFAMSKGDIAVARVDEGHAVAKLVDINTPLPASNPEGMNALRDSLSRSLEDDLIGEFTSALSQSYGISINARLVEDALTGF